MGSVVAHQLVAAGHEADVIDDLSRGFFANLPAAARIPPDIDPQRFRSHLRGAVDEVLHFAAKISVAESVAHPDRFWHTNIEGSLALLRAIRAAEGLRVTAIRTMSDNVRDYRRRTNSDGLSTM
ncbi:NAD-dependent epimerase/dehydratase family protein [Nocardia terpenica]|uniref:NAD-dependent epimerase/dehydratase family protein n=1 Tax=Nocardia terpenica TaxID=455432 RepID=A0A6G9Z9G1_9NOCA|nr:NAD-dependent epimerase/dehydratase family protein [Nocardia terpenica]